MKKKLVLLGLCILLVSGCGKTIPTLSNGDEAVVKFEDGSMISVNELYEEVKNTLSLRTLLNMIDKKILEAKYPDDIEDAKTSAQSSLDSIKAQYGDDALGAIQYFTGLETFEAFVEYSYINYLQDLYIEEYARDQITDKDIEKYYKDEIVGDIKVSHILIVPEVTDNMTDDEVAKAEKTAKEEVENIIKTLKDTKKADIASKFAELAKEKSDDQNTGKNGGDMGYINKTTLDSSYKDFATEAYKLKDGEYTTSIITTELGYHVILRVETKEKAKLETVKDTIIETLADKLRTDDATVAIKAIQQLRKDAGIDIIDSELKTQYTNYIQNALAQAKKQNEEKE